MKTILFTLLILLLTSCSEVRYKFKGLNESIWDKFSTKIEEFKKLSKYNQEKIQEASDKEWQELDTK